MNIFFFGHVGKADLVHGSDRATSICVVVSYDRGHAYIGQTE